MQACPYDALYIDPATRTAAKCNYCAHRIDRGLEPACVNVCPTQAIVSGDLDDPESAITQLRGRHQVTARKPEKGTIPALFYIDGDLGSLSPHETTSSGAGMWSEQTRGVGHYAKFLLDAELKSGAAENQRDTSSPAEATLVDSLEKFLALGQDQTGVLDAAGDPRSTAAGKRLAAELTRRTYDAPRKGTLWGWQVPAYMWTKAVSAGCVLLPMVAALFGWATPSLATQAAGAILGLLFLGGTGALLMADLDQPRRFVYVLLRPQWRSWLVRGAYLITAFGAALVVWLGVALFVQGAPPAWLGAVLVVLAVATAGYTALLFAQAKGRDFWQSPLLGVHMVAHAVMAGSAVYLLVVPWSRDPAWPRFVWVTAVTAIAVKLVCDGLELATTHPSVDAARTVRSIVRGRYARLYWGGVVLAGCLVPLGLLTISTWVAPIAGLAMLAGVYLAEHIWVSAPQQLPLA
jgi:formate-dependent nitrite reductase membrane component NrfD